MYERGHRIGNAVLGQCDHVHIPLDHDHPLKSARVLARLPQTIELARFLKHRGLGGIEVLGFVVAEYATAKGDNTAALILNREHHPVAKAVVGAALIVLNQHARAHESLLRCVVAALRLQEVVPSGRGKADAKIPGDLAGQPATLEVVHHFVPLRVLAQRALVEFAGEL